MEKAGQQTWATLEKAEDYAGKIRKPARVSSVSVRN